MFTWNSSRIFSFVPFGILPEIPLRIALTNAFLYRFRKGFDPILIPRFLPVFLLVQKFSYCSRDSIRDYYRVIFVNSSRNFSCVPFESSPGMVPEYPPGIPSGAPHIFFPQFFLWFPIGVNGLLFADLGIPFRIITDIYWNSSRVPFESFSEIILDLLSEGIPSEILERFASFQCSSDFFLVQRFSWVRTRDSSRNSF